MQEIATVSFPPTTPPSSMVTPTTNTTGSSGQTGSTGKKEETLTILKIQDTQYTIFNTMDGQTVVLILIVKGTTAQPTIVLIIVKVCV